MPQIPWTYDRTHDPLIAELWVAHKNCAQRACVSTVAMRAAWAGTYNLSNALIAGLATFGDVHAPIQKAMNAISTSLDLISMAIRDGTYIAGWGNAFVKGKPDPIWDVVDWMLDKDHKELHVRIHNITTRLHEHCKLVWPNAAAYTAAVALATNTPPDLAPWLAFAPRLEAWLNIIQKENQNG